MAGATPIWHCGLLDHTDLCCTCGLLAARAELQLNRRSLGPCLGSGTPGRVVGTELAPCCLASAGGHLSAICLYSRSHPPKAAEAYGLLESAGSRLGRSTLQCAARGSLADARRRANRADS